MYRMELKDYIEGVKEKRNVWVPNVPYGVESCPLKKVLCISSLFLMYRMELKATI